MVVVLRDITRFDGNLMGGIPRIPGLPFHWGSSIMPLSPYQLDVQTDKTI